MYFEKNRRQRGEIKKGAYGEGNRVRITQLVIESLHLEAINKIHKKNNSSKSYILEEMLKHSLLYAEIDKSEIVRLKNIPTQKKIRYIASHTISKNVLEQIRAVSKTYHSTLSVVVWHLLTLFFHRHPHYLQEEYLKS